MPRRVQRLNGKAVAFDQLAVPDLPVRHEILVARRVQFVDLAEIEVARGAVRAFGDDRPSDPLLQRPRQRRMIPMRVADEDVADGPAADGADQRLQMGLVPRARIEHRHRVAADHVGVGALEGKGRDVRAGHPQHVFRHRHRLAMARFELAIKIHRDPSCSARFARGSARRQGRRSMQNRPNGRCSTRRPLLIQRRRRVDPARGLGRSQAVRQRFLVPPCAGSNPAAPATFVKGFD